MSISEDIDLYDFIKFSYRKYILICAITLLSIVSGGLFCYFNSDKLTVTMDVIPKIYPPFFYTSCNDDNECRDEMFKTLLASKLDSVFVIDKVKKSNLFTVKSTFNKADDQLIKYNLSSLNSELIKWYSDDVNSTIQELDKLQNDKKATETIARMVLIATTTKRYLDSNDIIVFSQPVYSQLYSTRLVLIISVLLGLTFSFLCLMTIYSWQEKKRLQPLQ